MRKLTLSTAVKSPKRTVRRSASMAASPSRMRRRGGIAPRGGRGGLFRQQRDEGSVERRGAGGAQYSSSGVPVASTRPAFIATQPSKRAASSMYGGAGDHDAEPWAGRGGCARSVPRTGGRQRFDAGGRLRRGSGDPDRDQRAAQPSFCFNPPDSLPADRSANGREADDPEAIRRCDARARAAVAEHAAEEIDVLEHRQRRIKVTCRGPAACRRCAGRCGCGGRHRPCRRRAPRCGPAGSRARRRPARAGSTCRRPSGPIRPTMRPPVCRG